MNRSKPAGVLPLDEVSVTLLHDGHPHTAVATARASSYSITTSTT
ncbi:hypothetical protein [Amycolatopsis thailandensis]|nr:hypothetical protein [Amycolatopsis thailandensis]